MLSRRFVRPPHGRCGWHSPGLSSQPEAGVIAAARKQKRLLFQDTKQTPHPSSSVTDNPNGSSMPSRKSLSSDVAPSSDSRRTSMKRLSSIASLAHLNPFHRRRSNNASDSITSLCSDNSLSLPSAPTTAATSSSSRKPSESSSTIISDTAPLVAPPIPIESQASFLRRSSYVCLPDDPIGGMPRSRTFSNLPIPSRSKKPDVRVPSDSHTRRSSNLTTATRLLSPPASTRRHLMGSMPTSSSRYQNVRNRMKRSDTMPLLPLNTGQMTSLPRPTAFKENLSLSPIRPLPELDQFEEANFSSSLPAGSYMEDQLWDQTSPTTLPRDPSFSGALPVTAYTGNSPSREEFNFYSEPAYQPKRAFPPRSSSFAKPTPVQRWNSQPVLTNTTNTTSNRASGHHEIRQTRLLSARQAPTPPLSRNSISVQELGAPATLVRGGSVSRSVHQHLRRSSTHTLLSTSFTPQHAAGQISVAEPSAYWCGRVSALIDRYRNEDLAASLDSTNSKAQTDKFHSPATNTARLRRALEHLHSLCVTDEARESFVRFQMNFATMQHLPELSRPIKPRNIAPPIEPTRSTPYAGGLQVERNSAVVIGGAANSGARKMSLLDRMLGRREKRLSHG